MIRRTAPVLFITSLSIAFVLNAQQASAPASAALHEVKAVQVEPTLVANPGKVKDPAAANLVEDSLEDALRKANIQIVDDAQVRAHVVLYEFTSGSLAKRTVGFGMGRSSIACRLVLQDASGKELASVPIQVRGNQRFSNYEGNGT